MFTLITNNTNKNVRREMVGVTNYLVVPVIMLLEGVHCGSMACIYHPLSELQKFPAAWNGIPIVVGHPVNSEGIPTSANDPEIINKEKVGTVYNTAFEDSKLIADMYLNFNLLLRADPEIIVKIDSKEGLEISTGMFHDLEDAQGTWNDEEFVGIARDYRPDHLALLPNGIGACSISDGCGVVVNIVQGNNSEEKYMDKRKKVKREEIFNEEIRRILEYKPDVLERPEPWDESKQRTSETSEEHINRLEKIKQNKSDNEDPDSVLEIPGYWNE